MTSPRSFPFRPRPTQASRPSGRTCSRSPKTKQDKSRPGKTQPAAPARHTSRKAARRRSQRAGPKGKEMNFTVEQMSAKQVYNLLIGLVAPRPIALVTSLNEQGQLNAAPFSAYNYLCTDPPVVALGVTNRPDDKHVAKDTAHNIRRPAPAGGHFVTR